MIKNKTKKTILSKNCTYLTRATQHAKGLMFAKKQSDFAYIFIFKNQAFRPIHMQFVFFAIDVLWLDKDKRVVSMHQSAKPFSLYIPPTKKATYIIELPEKTIQQTQTTFGDIIDFVIPKK